MSTIEPIFCIMWTGDTISDTLRNLLYNTAQAMFEKKVEEKKINEDWCEGIIRTKFAVYGIGNVYGFKFTATIEWGNKKTEIDFIIKETDFLFYGRWADYELPTTTAGSC